MIELKDTVDMMLSEDYKERFKAEYHQVHTRYQKLTEMVYKWDHGTLTFTPTCPRELYDTQLKAMSDYIKCLEKRAIIEEVTLFEDKCSNN